MSPRLSSFLLGAAVAALPAVDALAASILSPSDFIIAIDGNRNLPGNTNTGTEGPEKVFDETNTTKWFSGARAFSGLIVTPAGGPAVVQSLSFTSGNDAPERNPVSFQLFGTNSPITSVNNGTGLEDPWTFIGGGSTGLGDPTSPAIGFNTTGPAIDVPNANAYASYKILFTKLRSANANPFDPVTLANGANPNGVQLSEARLFNAPAGGGVNVAANPTAPVIAIDQTDSFYPPGERPVEAIDGIKTGGSKYLNFGREGSGLIITPAAGPSIVQSFRITTGNDTAGRDPSSYILYGTNDPISSLDNSEGTAEAWTQISLGNITLPDLRNVDGPLVGVTNATSYASYKIVFPTVKGPVGGSVNSVQFSEIQFYTTPIPEPTSLGLLGLAVAGLFGLRRRA
jgi:hypothetical protein